MNLDERLIEVASTLRTRAIVPVHNAGVACAMDVITTVAKRHNPKVVEDAVQGIEAGKAAGMKVIAVATTRPREDLCDADLIVDGMGKLNAKSFNNFLR